MALIFLNLNKTEFDTTISEGITLVDFWAPWCGPCKTQLSILETLAEKIDGKAKIAKVNIDEAESLAGQFSVQAIPTLVLFKNGKEAKRFIGVQTERVLITEIEKIL